MADMTKIPTAEMVDDYYASKADAKTCARLNALDGNNNKSLTERVATNRKIMAIIEKELERRGKLHLIQEEG